MKKSGRAALRMGLNEAGKYFLAMKFQQPKRKGGGAYIVRSKPETSRLRVF